MKIRIDKLLSSTGLASRSEAAKAVARGGVRVDGRVVSRPDEKVDPEVEKIEYLGRPVSYEKYVYIMLNKPAGYVSSTDPKDGQTVLQLLPGELQKRGLFPCGRLDKDTLGLILLTNDGETAHYLLSPKRHVSKVYYVKTLYPFTEKDKDSLENGVSLDRGDVARPAKVKIAGTHELYITIVEGMYHQIKRMLEALDNKVVYLERVEFGKIPLDINLKRGEWRRLTQDEINLLTEQTK